MVLELYLQTTLNLFLKKIIKKYFFTNFDSCGPFLRMPPISLPLTRRRGHTYLSAPSSNCCEVLHRSVAPTGGSETAAASPHTAAAGGPACAAACRVKGKGQPDGGATGSCQDNKLAANICIAALAPNINSGTRRPCYRRESDTRSSKVTWLDVTPSGTLGTQC